MVVEAAKLADPKILQSRTAIDDLAHATRVHVRAPGQVQETQAGTTLAHHTPRRVPDGGQAGQVQMNQAVVLPDQLMNGAAADMTALQGDVLEVLAGLDEPFGLGVTLHLDATSEVEISHERAGGADDLDERVRRDVPIEGRGVQVPPELTVETEAVPGPTDDGTSDNLTGLDEDAI